VSCAGSLAKRHARLVLPARTSCTAIGSTIPGAVDETGPLALMRVA
jgi:hypothetical protein